MTWLAVAVAVATRRGESTWDKEGLAGWLLLGGGYLGGCASDTLAIVSGGNMDDPLRE